MSAEQHNQDSQARANLHSIAESLRSRSLFWEHDADVERLRKLGESAAGEILEFLSHENPCDRWAAVLSMCRLGIPKPAISLPALVKVLDDSDINVRLAAHDHLLGHRAPPVPADAGAAPGLVRVLRRPGGKRSLEGAKSVLISMGRIAIPFLTPQLESTDKGLCLRVLQIIRGIGDGAADAVPALAEMFTHEDKYVRLAAIEALSAVGAAGQAAVPSLIALLRDTATCTPFGRDFSSPYEVYEVFGHCDMTDSRRVFDMQQPICAVAAEALHKITGRDFGLDRHKWSAWWRDLERGRDLGR